MTEDRFEGLDEDDATVVARTYRMMNEEGDQDALTMPEKLALACRYLANQGHAMSLAGQISGRGADGSFWTTEFTRGFADATAASMVRVSANLDVLEGTGIPNPAARFHSWVYAARPDVQAIVHTHPPHVSALVIGAGREVSFRREGLL